MPKKNIAQISCSPGSEPPGAGWILRIYTAGRAGSILAALDDLKKICSRDLRDRYRIEVIDLTENPRLAGDEQIVALPVLLDRLPLPLRDIVSGLSGEQGRLVGFDLRREQ